MEDRVKYELTLPCGILNSDGTEVNRSVSLYEMKAKTKASLGKKNIRSNLTKQTHIVLEDCVADLGGNQSPTKNDFNRLLAADRDFILLQIRKLSLEPTIIGDINCPKCEQALKVPVPIDQLPVSALPDPGEEGSDMSVVTPETWKYAVRVFPMVSTEYQFSGLFRYPTVEDSNEVNIDLDDDPFGYFQTMIGRCAVTWDYKGKKVGGPISVSTVGELPIRVLEWVENLWRANQPGPDLSITVNCLECSNKVGWVLDPSDFFIRNPTLEKSGKLKKLSSK